MFKKPIYLLRIYTFLVLLVGLSFGFTPQPNSPLAKHEHPRMHITVETVPHWRTVLAEKYRSEYQEYVNWAADMSDNDSYNVLNAAGHDPLRAVMVHQAFIAAIGQVSGISYPISIERYAERAINSLIRRLNAGDELSYVAALTYDWTYNFMTDDQRRTIADIVVNRTIAHKVFEATLSNPFFTPEQMFSSKYYEGCYPWYIALAFWGDGLIDSQADQSLDAFASEMLNYGYLDAANFVAGNSGGFSEWIGYSSWHPRTHILNVDAWYTATGEDYLSKPSTVDGNALANYPMFMFHVLDPHKYFNEDYSYIRVGTGETTDASFAHRSMREQMYVLPRVLDQVGLSDQAALLRHLLQQYDVKFPKYEHHFIWAFLGLSRSGSEETPQQFELAPSMWSKNLGLFAARTGFDNPADGVFLVMGSHYRFEGHGGPDDSPGFALAKFGELANTRNVAHRGYGNLDDYPGARKMNIVYFEGGHTTAHHTLETPNELQQAVNGEGDFDWGGIEQVTKREGIFYHVRVNRSRMFTDGVTHQREYVWLPGKNPSTDSDFLVVFDRTQAPDMAEWVYHVPWKPEAFGFDSKEDLTTGSGTSERIGDAYLGSNVIIKEFNGLGGPQDGPGGDGDYVGGGGAHGVLFCKTILPDQARVEVTRVAQFDNNVLKRQHELAIKSHRWQISVKPQTLNTHQRFLNVFQAADANRVQQMTTVDELHSGSSMQGVFIHRESSTRPNYVVLFFNEDSLNGNVISYNLDGSGNTIHVITGLKANKVYQIKQISGGQSSTFNARTETDIQKWDYKGAASNPTEGVLYFESDLNGSTTFTLSPYGVNDSKPPAKPQGLRLK